MGQRDLMALSAAALSRAMELGHISACELMEQTLARIEVHNPDLNAIVALRDRDTLMEEARRADTSPRRGWLHGIPMAIKDLAEVGGIRTTFGSPLFAHHVPEHDEPLVASLRRSGAILIGKTNTPEFGLGSHTYNTVYGVTRNPFDRSRSAGGSSGGAAAALAARLVAVADGSDMMGSLRNPAAWNGVYGFRPSLGVVPGSPEGEQFFNTLATHGPMARHVGDLALLLDTMAVYDRRQPFSRHYGDRFAASLGGSVTGHRIGWIGDWEGHYPLEEGISELCETALDQLAQLGCVVEKIIPHVDPEALWAAWTTLRSWCIGNKLADFFLDAVARQKLKPEACWEAERGLALSAREVHLASQQRSAWYRTAWQLFEDYDVLALPSAQLFPFPSEWDWPRRVAGREMDTYHRWMEVVVPASLAGLPTISVPTGINRAGLPMGMQLIGPPGGDAALLNLAHAYEQHLAPFPSPC